MTSCAKPGGVGGQGLQQVAGVLSGSVFVRHLGPHDRAIDDQQRELPGLFGAVEAVGARERSGALLQLLLVGEDNGVLARPMISKLGGRIDESAAAKPRLGEPLSQRIGYCGELQPVEREGIARAKSEGKYKGRAPTAMQNPMRYFGSWRAAFVPPMSQSNLALEDGRFAAFLTQPRLRLFPVRASCVYPQLGLSIFCEHRKLSLSPS